MNSGGHVRAHAEIVKATKPCRANGGQTVQALLNFFPLVAYRRQAILCDEPIRTALRNAIAEVRTRRPFAIDAWVLLPDHLHCLWTLPPEDTDFARTSVVGMHR